MNRTVVLWVALGAACSAADSGGGAAPEGADASAGAPITDEAGPVEAAATDPDANAACPPLKNDTPRALECTGLYSNLVTKQVQDGVREFTPSVPLWSDGADKTRWISLPMGSTIDATNASEWTFPVGTKFWKEFKVAGHRIETRFFQKLGDDNWVHASYRWADDELSAARADGADLTVNDAAYRIPTPSECDKCHNGRRDRILGFEAISLGSGTAAGITLDVLAREARLSPPPSVTKYTIGDDGTGKAAKALGWLHINCGVSCHNGNTTATAYPTGLRLRLDPAQLDGSAVTDSWQPIVTALNVGAVTPRWAGSKRIVPGLPDSSLLVRLISQRGSDQMPPLGSFVVDTNAVQFVREWIAAMPEADGGVPEGGADASVGAGDAGRRRDAGPPDAAADADNDGGGDADATGASDAASDDSG